MRTSQRLNKVQPSLTLEIDAKAKALKAAGRDVVGFAAGEPDLPPPDAVREAGERAIRDDLGRYTAVAGILPLREAVGERYREDWGLEYGPDQILVSSGAKQSLLNALYVVCDAGDEVLIPTPYWTSYPEMAISLGIEPVLCATRPDGGIDIDELEAKTTPRTRAMIINSPSNPTGRVVDQATVAAIAKFAERRDLWIISDDIYAQLVFDADHRFFNAPMAAPEAKQRTIAIYGLSKTFGMTGWRIGFAAGPADVIKQMSTFQSHATSCANTIAQHAGVAALREVGAEYYESLRTTYSERAAIVTEGLGNIEGMDMRAPVATFYAFPDVSALFGRSHGGHRIDTAMDLAGSLLEKKLVAVVPGEAFGDPDSIRMSFATSEEQIREGIRRVAAFVDELDPPAKLDPRPGGGERPGFHTRPRD